MLRGATESGVLMATTEIAPSGSATSADRTPIVNDFSIQVATANGSGSQSANSILLRSIFQMGVPVSGKNLFPSNIAGLPTWFTIRASKKGYIARKKEIDFVVAMNPETAREDALNLAPGAGDHECGCGRNVESVRAVSAGASGIHHNLIPRFKRTGF